MTEQPAPRILSADSAAALAEFARACKAAARAVSLYPGGHPAITSSLGRLAQLSARMTERGPYRVTVLADTLLVDGASMPKPDAGVTELAELLHRHLIGRLTVNAGANADSWRSLLLLLARTPESVRADGGIGHLWSTAGGPSIEIDQIDYGEVLRDKQGVAAAIEQILSAALSGAPLELDDSGIRLLLEIVQEPARLADLMRELDEAGARHGADVQAAAFLNLVRALIDWLSVHDHPRIEPVFQELGQAAGRLSAEAMLKVLDLRGGPESRASGLDVASAVVDRMSDDSLSGFVARSVVRERGATERLAHAFQALVPDADRQRRLLARAEADVRASEGITEEFPELWARVENMLTSYSDESFVSDQYARELSRARTQAVDVERISDDPPERISAWIETVTDASLRTLDQQLLIDLLRIETDLLRWRDIADTAAAHAEDLIRMGAFDQAWQIARAIVSESDREPARRPHASTALERFARASLVQHVASHLRSAEDGAYEQVTLLCHAIGPTVIPALAEALS